MVDLSNQVAKAFEFASNFSRDLVNLAAGVIALSMTFAKDFLGDAGFKVRGALCLSWLLFLVSIGAGIVVNMILTGSLVGSDPVAEVGDRVLIPGQVQVVTFGAAIVTFATLGISTVLRRRP